MENEVNEMAGLERVRPIVSTAFRMNLPVNIALRITGPASDTGCAFAAVPNVVALSHSDESETRRHIVALAIWEEFGEVALQDDLLILLNGTSLRSEIVEQAIAPTVVYVV